ncbi:MAG: ABC transporter substrate-binding protein [Chloroflexi bacterium]|nr:ABC transporter substrate-binding protein [Chloroflexota bacterium]MBM3175265.1 ABC transporter substrate-binding protein [Chloroflexota bacterium]MBM4451154.1 ABC transporter substrate-binding protein [Chloroflexota bacterium]
MNPTKTKLSVVLTVLVTVIAIVGVSCAKTEAPPTPAKWDKIVIPVAANLSGPYGAQSQVVINGLTDCLGYVNEQGGVKGVPLEFLIRDTAGKPDNAMTILTEFLAMKPRPALVSFLDSQDGVSLKQRFIEEKTINMMGIGSGPGLYPAGYTFAISTENGDLFGAFCDYIVEKEAPKKPKLGILTWDNVFGKVILEQRCLDYAKSKGVDIVSTQLFNVMDTTVADQLKKIKDAGAEWIYTNTLLIGPARINNDAITLGIQDKMKWGVAGVAISYNTMGLGKGMEGWIGPSPWASWDETSIQGIQVMRQQFEKNKREDFDKQNVYCGAFIAALLMKQTFEKAVDKYGWDGITGPNVLAVLEETKDFDAMGMTKISFSKEMRHGLFYKMYEMKQGKILPLTDWRQATHLK